MGWEGERRYQGRPGAQVKSFRNPHPRQLEEKRKKHIKNKYRGRRAKE